MTAINMFVQPSKRAGFILSDGAHTHPVGGQLLENHPKIVHGGGRFPFAMGVSGNVHPRILGQALGEANPLNLKQLVKRLPGAMRLAIERTKATTTTPPEDIALHIAGVAWDFAGKQPIGFVISSHPEQFVGPNDPFAWYDCPSLIACAEHGDLNAQLGRTVDLSNPLSFDAESDGRRLMANQRVRPSTPTLFSANASVQHRIGGDIDLTEVTKHGVKVWKIDEYPDPIGEPIDPSRPASSLLAG